MSGARLSLRLTLGEGVRLGPGKIALLEAIGETGSISAAARRLRMSYRRAWLLADSLNQAMEAPAVAGRTGGSHGGGAQLTDSGRALVALYRRMEGHAANALTDDLSELGRLMRPPGGE